MKLTVIAAATLSLFAANAMANPAASIAQTAGVVAAKNAATSAQSSVFKSNEDKLSYTIGVDLGTNFKKQNVTINAQALTQGVKDALSSSQLKMSKSEMEFTLQKFQRDLIAKRAQSFKKQADNNKQIGKDFLAKNKIKPGVVTMDDGLQYKIIKAGDGPMPAASDRVEVNYTGRLIDGKVFDSTAKTKKPVTFKVSEVIPGWSQALQKMKQGAQWQVFIPAKLAYGERGIGGPIGPNETLIFDIELLKVYKNSNQATPAAKPAKS